MATPTYTEYASLSTGGPGFNSETLEERLLTLFSVIASGTNPDGSAWPGVPSGGTGTVVGPLSGDITTPSSSSGVTTLQNTTNVQSVVDAITGTIVNSVGTGDTTLINGGTAAARTLTCAARTGDVTRPAGSNVNTLIATPSVIAVINAVLANAVVWVTGLTNDGGVTDNTAVLAAAAATLPATGGTLILPSGKFGCNWTAPSNISLIGQGFGSPTQTNGSTCLCGLNSLVGTQTATLTLSNNAINLFNLTVDGGTSTSSYWCTQAVLLSGNDGLFDQVTINNGQQVSLNQTSACNRHHMGFVRVSNGATNYVAKTHTITITGTTTFTITGGTSITSADIGNVVFGTGIPLGTVIVSITTPGVNGVFVVDQPCTNAAGVTVTELWGASVWLLGIDNVISDCRFNFGTKRFGGSGGLMSNVHNTFSTPASGGNTAAGCCNVLLEGGWGMATCYFDSSPAGAGSTTGAATLVHKTAAGSNVPPSSIASPKFFQNSVTNDLMFVENDATYSVKFVGGTVDGGGAAKAYSVAFTLPAGGNGDFSVIGMDFKNSTVVTNTANLLAGGAPQGIVDITYAGNRWAYSAFFAVTTPPISTTVYQNTSGLPLTLSIPFTATTIGATVTLSVGPASGTLTAVATITPDINTSVTNLVYRVPVGWYYKFVFTNASAGTLTGLASG